MVLETLPADDAMLLLLDQFSCCNQSDDNRSTKLHRVFPHVSDNNNNNNKVNNAEILFCLRSRGERILVTKRCG